MARMSSLVVIVLVAHDGDRTEQRPGESVADRRKENLFLLRHVIQQGFQEDLQGVGEAGRRERMIEMHRLELSRSRTNSGRSCRSTSW